MSRITLSLSPDELHLISQALQILRQQSNDAGIPELASRMQTLSDAGPNDKKPFNGLLSLQQAADRWGIDSSTIRHAIRQQRLYEGLDCQKYGKQWVITESAMYRVFGADASGGVFL